jgi:prepilin-type processing-associated H-X9-DG protein
MNVQELLDYTLGQLEGPSRERAERELLGDSELAEKVERLSQALYLLLDDGPPADPPADLTSQTVAFVAANRRRVLHDYVPMTVPFRWADFAVAAGIFLAGLLTLLPAVQRSKDRMYQASCGLNLQQLGRGLAQYATLHHVYPYATPGSPTAHAGTFAVMLHDAGLLHDVSTIHCPCRGPCQHPDPMPSSQSVAQLRAHSPAHYLRLLGQNDYAYHLGFRNKSGRAGPVPVALTSQIPLLADQPAHQAYRKILDGNSPNHGGRGQNVLFTDGHVLWHATRRIGPEDADMFLNAEQQIAPGVNEKDAALVPSLVPFAGYED